jgi:hypothetical protein
MVWQLRERFSDNARRTAGRAAAAEWPYSAEDIANRGAEDSWKTM